jgi:hypothetical protein
LRELAFAVAHRREPTEEKKASALSPIREKLRLWR